MKALVLGPNRPGFESWLHHLQLCDLGQHTEHSCVERSLPPRASMRLEGDDNGQVLSLVCSTWPRLKL